MSERKEHALPNMRPELIVTAGGCVTNTISFRLSVRNNNRFFYFNDNTIFSFRQLKKLSHSTIV